MFTLFHSPDTVKFIFYSLGITEDMINKKESGKIGTKTILRLVESGLYTKTKTQVLQINGNNQVDLDADEFYTFCTIVDFTARCLVSTVFSERLREIHNKHPFATNTTFDELKAFYLKYATQYFDNIKSIYGNEKRVLEIIKAITDWEMNDSDFL